LIELKKITKKYDNHLVLNEIDYYVKREEFSAIMGDSGSGKTTILRIISGLIRPNSGIVKIDNDEVDSKQVYIEPFKRSLGFVFQEASLWPHMTVAENVKFGIKEKDKVKTNETLEQIMEQTNTINFRNKYPSQISGGQAKRVSIARALAAKPKYVLLDEPLVNLDQKAKIELLDLLVIIKEKSDAGFVYVSHQKDEIDYLGSTLWILEDGRLVKDE